MIKMPKNPHALDDYLDDTEVQTRMSQVIYNFHLVDLNKLDWDADFESNGIDEYEQIAIVTGIEHEFHTVFEDHVFDNFKNFSEIRRFVANDHNCF
jgi:acyl carrier protein